MKIRDFIDCDGCEKGKIAYLNSAVVFGSDDLPIHKNSCFVLHKFEGYGPYCVENVEELLHICEKQKDIDFILLNLSSFIEVKSFLMCQQDYDFMLPDGVE